VRHLLGKKVFSGKFMLRVEPAIYRRLTGKTMATGESYNRYCVKTLVKAGRGTGDMAVAR
jgi:predicted HicB family RNase H-like nuclease